MISRISMFLLAMEYYGLKEIPGEQNNPIIMRWFRDIGYSWVQADETAWCSCFINWLAYKLDLELSGELTARSWLRVGQEIITPQIGNIVVLWREDPDSWKGHVGLYAGGDDDYVYMLGGNQSNQVNIQPKPKSRVLGYRSLPVLDISE